MVRLVWALGLVLFLAACGGGSGGGGSGIPASLLGTQEISSRAQELVNANPIFIGSDVVLIYDGDDGERAIERDSSARCGMDECVIDDQETSLAALLFAEGFNPTERRRGVDLGRGSLQHFEGEIQRYGGWLENSAFAVHSGILTDGTPGTEGYARENIIHSYSVGVPASTNPVSGSASWNGVMVGAEVSGAATAGNFVRGDATLTADFAAVNVDVVFNNIRDLTTSAPRADITWNDIPITGGAFRTDTIQGSFYGQNHEEVGGIFGRSNLQGAFGAKR